MRRRLVLEDLDDEDPFEIDMGNEPHLFKHDNYGTDDLLDIWASHPVFFEARDDGPADWLMVDQPPGEDPLCVPLAPSKSGDPRKARPIGIYPATGKLLASYRRTVRETYDQWGERDVRR
jgi:hypothetical protein